MAFIRPGKLCAEEEWDSILEKVILLCKWLHRLVKVCTNYFPLQVSHSCIGHCHLASRVTSCSVEVLLSRAVRGT